MPFKSFVANARNRIGEKIQTSPQVPPDQAIQDNAANILARDRRRQDEERRQAEENARRLQEARDEEARQHQRHQEQLDRQRRIDEANAAAERKRIELFQQEQREIENAKQQQRLMQKRHNASAQSVGRLRSLIRERYRLDVWIWSQRKVPRADRHIIMEDCQKADAILQQIYAIVSEWDKEQFDNEEYPEEWKMAETIKKIIGRQDQHVVWCQTPPWECAEDGAALPRRPAGRPS